MKTKREILLDFAKRSTCGGLICDECPYSNKCSDGKDVLTTLVRIGAKTILRMFPEKREFDPSRILTCVTADKAKVGMKGYFADNLAFLRANFEKRYQVSELVEILDDRHWCRFRNSEGGVTYGLFYPIDEVEE